MVPVLVAAAPAYAEWHGNAHIETVEVTGSYLTDDISEAGLKKAREEAHKDAPAPGNREGRRLCPELFQDTQSGSY